LSKLSVDERIGGDFGKGGEIFSYKSTPVRAEEPRPWQKGEGKQRERGGKERRGNGVNAQKKELHRE